MNWLKLREARFQTTSLSALSFVAASVAKFWKRDISHRPGVRTGAPSAQKMGISCALGKFPARWGYFLRGWWVWENLWSAGTYLCRTPAHRRECFQIFLAIFLVAELPPKRCFGTQEFTRFLSTVSAQYRATQLATSLVVVIFILRVSIYVSFFRSFFGFEEPINHWTKRMVSARLTT